MWKCFIMKGRGVKKRRKLTFYHSRHAMELLLAVMIARIRVCYYAAKLFEPALCVHSTMQSSPDWYSIAKISMEYNAMRCRAGRQDSERHAPIRVSEDDCT